MDAKEIGILVRALNKATTASEPAAAFIDILNKLKTGVTPTEELLRSTKIGVVVNKQRHHGSPEVARLATEIVTRWKEEVGKNKAKKANGSAKNAAAHHASKGRSVTPGKKSSSPELKVTVPADQRTWKTDLVDVKRTGNTFRDNCLGLMYNGLAFNAVDAPSHVLKRAMDVEFATMKKYGPETEGDYKQKLRSLYQNFKNKSNPELRAHVLSGEISPTHLVVMSFEELKSAKRRAEDKMLLKENMDKAMVAQVEKSVSSALQCGKCHKKLVSYSQAQTRSADEPMTTFCECQVCGHRWKFS
ncbi:MAG: RNA polymerase II elongation factor [Phylliscum demangeonii]|nr:MAG: RNA polymerase II elongation factor [Phylliscum demangeonii]